MGDFWIGGTIQGPVIQLVIIGCCLGRVIGSVTISHAPRASLECPHWAESRLTALRHCHCGATGKAASHSRRRDYPSLRPVSGGKRSFAAGAKRSSAIGRSEHSALATIQHLEGSWPKLYPYRDGKQLDRRKSSDLQDHAHQQCAVDPQAWASLQEFRCAGSPFRANWEPRINPAPDSSKRTCTAWWDDVGLYPVLLHAIFDDDVQHQDWLRRNSSVSEQGDRYHGVVTSWARGSKRGNRVLGSPCVPPDCTVLHLARRP